MGWENYEMLVYVKERNQRVAAAKCVPLLWFGEFDSGKEDA